MSYTRYSCSCSLCGGKSALDTGSSGTLPPPPADPVIVQAHTGDYRIDALLENLDFRWNKGQALGTSVTVTYSFMTAKPTYGGTDSEGDVGFQPFTSQQQAAVRDIFARLSAETGLRFTEVSDSDTSYGQIRFGNNTQQTSAGYAFLPHSTGDDTAGDVWISDTRPEELTNLAPGTAAYSTLVHEIGHALGLKHPGNYNGNTTSDGSANYLGQLEDSTLYTIMSYRERDDGLQRDWFGIYDLLALRTLYGAGTAGSGDTTLALADNVGGRMVTVVDSGGSDTLDLSGSTVGARVDLRPGAFSSVGTQGGSGTTNNVSIDLASIIENFIGTAGDDTVVGNSAANRLQPGAGNNTVDGGAGIDAAVFAAAASSYTVTVAPTGITVAGNGARDTLTNVERLAFSDVNLAFDANALLVARILGAVFGPAAVGNTSYARIGLSFADGGMDAQSLVRLALDARLGGGASNEAVVELLYTNVIGQPPGAAELAAFAGMITAGQHTQASLAVLAAEHALNAAHIGLTGIAANGLAFA